MKYIDFHTHAFNDKIAERAMARLVDICKLSPHTDGTASNLTKKMAEWGIDMAVLLPIATKPSQQTIVNDWAKLVQCEKITSFGSVHPDAEDALDELVRIKQLGLSGIKLHPDYQEFFVDDEKLFPIYRKCGELGLPIIFHAGFDPLSPNLIHARPEASLTAIQSSPETTMIFAHMGGQSVWDDVERFLVGSSPNVYLDLAFVAKDMNVAQAERIIKNHGADKILFASDCPWENPLKIIEFVEKMNLTTDEKELIYYKNAERLLNL